MDKGVGKNFKDTSDNLFSPLTVNVNFENFQKLKLWDFIFKILKTKMY